MFARLIGAVVGLAVAGIVGPAASPAIAFYDADLTKLLAGDPCEYCDLRRADLRGVDLSDADLRYAELSRANLATSDLSDANLVVKFRHLSPQQMRLRCGKVPFAWVSSV
jgi:hypothetical protein